MPEPLNILLIEDSPSDFLLTERRLQKDGLIASCRRVASLEEIRAAIGEERFDLIISDYAIQPADFMECFRFVQESLPDVPFILLSGAVGEDQAVELVKLGVSDFVVKDRMERLVPVIERSLREAAERSARRSAEQALRESEKRLARALDATTEGVWEWNVKTGEVFFSPRWISSLGYSPEEVAPSVGFWTSVVHPDDLPGVMAAVQAHLDGRTAIYECENRLRMKSGAYRDNLDRGRVVERDEDGMPLRMVGTDTDITERKRAEAKEREKEGRYLRQRNALITLATEESSGGDGLEATLRRITEVAARTLNVARVGIWRYSDDRTTMQCANLYELEPDRHTEGLELAVTATPSYYRALAESDLIAADDVIADPRTRELGGYFGANGVTSMMDAPIHSGGLVAGVLCHEHTGPARTWAVDEQAFAVAMANLISLALEESERRRAEAVVRENEARHRLQIAALNAAANAMIITDREGTIVWANPAFSRLTGYEAAEAIGRNPRDLVRSGVHDRNFYKRMWDTILAGGTWRGELTNRRRDGSHYPEMQTITPVQGADGEITHFIAIKADLTEQRNLEEQFRQAHRLEAVGQLAGGIAHEFNNLLQALLSMATVLRLRATGTAFAKIGADIETHVLRGAGLTRQLLQFSRRKPLEVARLDLGELVRREGVLLRRLIPENIRLVVDTAPGRWLEGDAGQLQQVLMNLVINARDAMPDGGTLTVRTSSAGGELTLEVADTGRGMDEATKLRIFEPFFTTKEAGKGTGLGLAVVLGIVQQHGGRIEVETEPGSGTRFRIVLSAAGEAGQEEIQPSALEAGVEQVRGMRVLLVEDEEGVREGVQALLEMLGYEVIAVGSGEEAVALSPMLRPELLLSDVTLPGITGSVVVQKLRERWPSLKVVLMSGYLPDDLPLDPGGVHFLQKPFGIDNLALALRAATEDLAAPPAR